MIIIYNLLKRRLRVRKVIQHVPDVLRNLHRWDLIQNSKINSVLTSHKRTHLEGGVLTAKAPERNATSISSHGEMPLKGSKDRDSTL